MQLNLYGILSVALALSSIFLPWISFSSVVVCMQGMGSSSRDISPLQISRTSAFCPANDTSFSFDYSIQWMPWPIIPSTWGLLDILHILLVASFLTHAYSICLIIHSAFANGSWSKASRRTLIVASFLSLSTILLCLTTLLTYLDVHFRVSPFRNGLSIIGEMAIAKLTYFNIGLLMALLSTLLAFLSWLRPRFVNLSTGIRIEGCDKLRDLLSIPEKEKLLAIFLSSFLVVLLFTIFYFILPTIKI